MEQEERESTINELDDYDDDGNNENDQILLVTEGSLGFLLLWVTELGAFPGSMLCENSWKLSSLWWWDMGSLNS